MANPKNHKTIRIPTAVDDDIERLQIQIYQSYVEGRTDKPKITEQGEKSWVSKGEVIRLCIAEFEDKKMRSKAKKKK